MSTYKNNLVPIRPEDPPAELIQEALNSLVQSDLAQFANNLETARSIWRKCREFVEAPKFPEQLRAAFVEENHYEPDDDCLLMGEEVLEAGHRESLLPNAVNVARCWMHNRREEDSDAKFLGALGISGEER